ncbi:hypothetical protein [Uliginosibacterium gangwonense]|uniref:hypothetical protein n=1 Tax=Uliginosibacterium gangwonense TaxID=392736 RepID=UPI00039DE48C|nr:hypothetical protein [Uliginosibacterium gangwonense]
MLNIASLKIRSAFSVYTIFLGLSLSGCNTAQYLRETNSVDATGAFQITDRDVVENVDLSSLLMEYAPRSINDICKDINKTEPSPPAPSSSAPVSTNPEGEKLNKALAYFNCQIAATADPGAKMLARNSVQERLLGASQQRCNAFKANLQRTFSRNNFGLGVLATISATLGALTTSPTAATHWAGSSAIFSGTRAEFNQDYMANLAAHIITEGIDHRREVVYDKIQTSGQNKSYPSYPVDAAIKDAFYYHGQCTVLAGFQEASDAIKYVKDPGINTSIMQLARFKAATSMLAGNSQEAVNFMKTGSAITDATPATVGSKLDIASQGNYDARFTAAVSQLEKARNDLKTYSAARKEDAKKQAKKDPKRVYITESEFDISFKEENELKTIVTDCGTIISEFLQHASTRIAGTTSPVTVLRGNIEEMQGASIAHAAQLLADDYTAKVISTNNGWTGWIESGKEDSKPDSAPTLDDTLKKNLDALCK